jgi:hypothetical protein
MQLRCEQSLLSSVLHKTQFVGVLVVPAAACDRQVNWLASGENIACSVPALSFCELVNYSAFLTFPLGFIDLPCEDFLCCLTWVKHMCPTFG